MKKSILLSYLCFSLFGCSSPSEETQAYAESIKLNFPKAAIVTSQDKKTLDFQVMFYSDSFPSENDLVKYFKETNKSLYTLAVSQKAKQASINFGVPKEGFRYRMNCFNQGMGLCDIGRGTLPNFTTLESSSYE